MIKSMVYYGNTSIGEVEVWPKGDTNSGLAAWAREIRVDRLSPPSERCLPLAVMHTVAVGARCLVMESRPPKTADEPPPPLVAMHTACIRDNKTAVVPLGDEELHLVAMTSRRNLTNHACFWGYKVPFGLYNSCLTMLNLRCLGIVFDLDETLIVANTTRSFEDRIDSLQRKLSNETDPQRINGMLAEIKRYQDDRSILKQYIEGDQVYDDGKMYKVQPEIVPPLSDNHQSLTRPVIRLQEKNIILTRINPLIRDTSVLVRLRPAWEDLRSYLIARGRKRFEVYVCTMAERDYALEMWRLLDPDSRLINSVQLSDRMVCVKSGLKKSLLNVFHDGSCHPGMALVIDDRLKVWDEKDQSRVHVVPAFTPYYAPQAEANCSIPVLCVARNVACNVRGGFFKDFDEGLLPRISNVLYEDEIRDISSAPDVGNYLISEDENAAVVNGNRDSLTFEGMADAEVERRMKEASGTGSAVNPTTANFVMPVAPVQNFVPSSAAPFAPPLGMMPLSNNQVPLPPFSQSVAQPVLLDPLQGSPAREEGEVPESELDPDTRRRLLILQHGQDTRDPTPPLPAVPPVQVPVPPVQPHGNWFPVEDGMNPNNVSRGSAGFPSESDTMNYDKKQQPHPSYFHGADNNPMPSDRFSYQNQRFPSQLTHPEDHRVLQNHAPPRYRSFSENMDPHVRDEEKEELIQCVIRGEDNLDVSTFLNNSGEGDPLFTGVDNLFEVEGVAFREGKGDALCNREDDRSGEPSGSKESTEKSRRGPTKKLQDHERFRIEDVAEDGRPTAPEVVATKFVAQCGVIFRDLIPIIIRNWNRPANADEEGTCLFVPNHAKDLLWKRLMVNFKLPKIELDPNAEDPVEDALQHGRAMEAKVREWDLKKMAQCFTNWKKILHLDYVVKKKTPDFKNIQFEKIKPFWDEFVEYKKSEKAKKMSETNKLNAAKKKYHHTMGQGGYRVGIPKWEKLEQELRDKNITPEIDDWVERARNWFYGHGGTLDSEGRCIYNIRHKEDPLPIERIRKAVKAVKDGDFIPDRENDELTLALGNKEHDGRTRGTRGSQSWRTGFPEERKKYPDRSRQRRKDRAAVEAESQKERMRLIEERLKQQQDEINTLKEQSTTGAPSQQHTAFDSTGLSNNRKSSVASTEVPGDDNGDADDAPTMAPVGYLVDDITEMTHCELHVKVVNISMKVAVGYALPIGPTPTYHCRPVPEGYAVVGVDEIMPTFEVLDLHYPAGEGDVTVLGDAKNVTILWPKDCIVLRNHTPRPSSPPRQPSSSPHPAPSPHQSPVQPSPREPSPAPQDKKRKRTATVRRKRSPKRKQEPLPKVPTVPPKRAYDCTEEETAAIVDAETTAFFAKLRRPKEPEFPSTKEEKAKVLKMLKNLHQP